MDSADIKQAAQTVAKILDEDKSKATNQIERLIEHIGMDFVEEQLKETQRIQAEGGLMTKKGDRKRTIGGVFFFVAKAKLTPEQQAIVFPPTDWKALKAKQKLRAAQQRQTVDNRKGQTKAQKPAPTPKPAKAPDKLTQLQAAADTLRERIDEMEAKGHKGIAMTQKLLQNTEGQIATLKQTDQAN